MNNGEIAKINNASIGSMDQSNANEVSNLITVIRKEINEKPIICTISLASLFILICMSPVCQFLMTFLLDNIWFLISLLSTSMSIFALVLSLIQDPQALTRSPRTINNTVNISALSTEALSPLIAKSIACSDHTTKYNEQAIPINSRMKKTIISFL